MRVNAGIIVGGLLLLLLICVIFLAPLITNHKPLSIDVVNRLAPPSTEHIFGTDDYGRDLFSRVLFGGQESFRIGLMTVLVSATLGTILGLLSGFYHKLDFVLMRLADGFTSFPVIILSLGIMAVLGQSSMNTIIALSIVYIPNMMRVVRSSTLSIKSIEYIEAAVALGASNIRILVVHIFPNVISPMIVQATLIFGYAIIAEATLSFLGLGTPPPAPSWGNILSEARTYIAVAPWMTLFPGLAILLSVLGLNILGDGLRDRFDPKMAT